MLCSVCPKTKEQRITLGFPVCLWRDQTRCNFLVWLSSGKSLGLRGCSLSLPAGQPGTASGHPQHRWHELGTDFNPCLFSAPFPEGKLRHGGIRHKNPDGDGEGTLRGCRERGSC